MENQTNRNFKNVLLNQPRKAVSGLVYSVAIVGMVMISLLFAIVLAAVAGVTETDSSTYAGQDWYKYLSYLLYQVVYIAVIFAFARIFQNKPRDFGYRKTHWKYYLIALIMQFGLLFGMNWVNNLFAMAIEKMGGTLPVTTLPSLSGGGIVGVLLVVALLPAVCEETLFRGIILDGIKDIGTVAACLLCGFLFSIFHQSPLQTAYQFICGACFALLAIRANSLLPAIAAHFCNNALIVFEERFHFIAGMSRTLSIILLVLGILAFAGSVGYMIFLDRKTDRKKEGEIKPLMICALAGIIVSAIVWVSVLVTYFV